MNNCPKCGAERDVPHKRYYCQSYELEGIFHQSHPCRLAQLETEVRVANLRAKRWKATAFVYILFGLILLVNLFFGGIFL